MTATPAPQTNHTAQGILLILGSVTIMAFSDALVKLISADLVIWQMFVLRAVIAAPCFAVMAWGQRAGLRPISIFWVTIRSLCLVLCWVFYYAGLPFLNLAVAAVVVYINPIITTLLSAAFLKETVSGRQWLGVCLGFLGVFVIMQPGGEDFTPYLLLPLIAAVLYSISMILTRSTCRDENPVTLGFGLHVAFFTAGLVATGVIGLGIFPADLTQAQPFLLGSWGALGWREWGLLALLGVLSAIYFTGVARAYQIAPPQIIATFDYGYLISAALWGFVLFSEALSRETLIGMALITLAGLLVAARGKSS